MCNQVRKKQMGFSVLSMCYDSGIIKGNVWQTLRHNTKQKFNICMLSYIIVVIFLN